MVSTLRTVWFEHRLVLLSIYCYLMLVWGVLALHGLASATPPAAQFRAGLVQLVGLTGLALCIRAFADRRTTVWFSSSKLLGAVVVALLSPAVVGIYSAWKQALALLVPYSWDVPLHHLSLRLFGAPEWTFFAWFYRHPLAIHSLDRFYFVAWGVATLATVLALAWTERRVLRMQALLATVLSWALLGSVGAALFGSGGPVFYRLFVGGADPYAPLHLALQQYPDLLSVQIQAYLTHAFQSRDWHALAGISAMPSMHVAQGCLTALIAHRLGSKTLRAAGWCYVSLLFLCSIVLGWHYAADGIASVLAVVAIWHTCGWIARREFAAWRPIASADARSPLPLRVPLAQL